MPALRPIIYDYIEDGRPSPEDQARVALRERATGATPPQLPTRRNRLGAAMPPSHEPEKGASSCLRPWA